MIAEQVMLNDLPQDQSMRHLSRQNAKSVQFVNVPPKTKIMQNQYIDSCAKILVIVAQKQVCPSAFHIRPNLTM